MNRKYCYRIDTLRRGGGRSYQLQIGLPGEPLTEYVPAHQTAFARLLPMAETHPSRQLAERELAGLIAWIRLYQGPAKVSEASEAALASLAPVD